MSSASRPSDDEAAEAAQAWADAKDRYKAARSSSPDLIRASAGIHATAFLRSIPGRARLAYGRGDALFQFEANVNHPFPILWGIDASAKSNGDINSVLNGVAREGWELVNASIAYHQTGAETRHRTLSSGQNMTTSGAVVGYYLFRRSDAARTVTTEELALTFDSPDPSPEPRTRIEADE